MNPVADNSLVLTIGLVVMFAATVGYTVWVEILDRRERDTMDHDEYPTLEDDR